MTGPMRRSRGRDPLGLGRSLADRLLPALVAAMTFLAALAVAGAAGAAAMAARWQGGPAATASVLLPPTTGAGQSQPARLAAALTAIRAMPEVADARAADPARLAALLRPWLGDAPPDGLPLPVVIELRLTAPLLDRAGFAVRLAAAVPEAVAEAHGDWVARLGLLARSLEVLAWGGLLLVAAVAAAVVAVAVRAGIAGAREAIAILHDLGAGDADIASRFAGRAARLVTVGALVGTVAALPVAAGFAGLAAPLTGGPVPTGAGVLAWGRLPWVGLLPLPPLAALIGWCAAQATVRLWLRRLP